MTLAILTAALAGAAQTDWLKLDTGRFQIFSQTSEADLRRLAVQLDTAAQILDALEPGAGTSGSLIKVFVFGSRTEFVRYGATKRAVEAGYHTSGAGGDVIAFLHDPSTNRPVILHEYGHLAMHRVGGRIPLWLDEGLAEIYSTIRVQGRNVVWGGPASLRVPLLQSHQLLGASEFFDGAQSARGNPDSAATFYAQAWAFAHMLRFGKEYPRGAIQEFRRQLVQNVAEEDAFERAFGKSRVAALDELPAYLRAARFTEQSLPVALPLPYSPLKPSPCSSEEAAFALADLLMQLGRTNQAEELYRELAGINRSGVEALKLLGDLALAQEKRDEAVRHYERALNLGSKSAALHFEYAMLLRDAGGPQERVQKLLELALELNPNLSGLQQFLANRAFDEGDYELAIRRFTGASLLEPGKPAVWLGLAYAHRAAGNREAARAAAERSASLAKEEPEKQMALAVLQDLESPQAAAPDRSRPKTIVPESWKNRQGDRRVEGVLVRIDCQGLSARLHLRTGEQTKVFFISDPRKVVLRNTPGNSREFRCGTFDGIRVGVEFLAAPEGQPENAGEVTALEFQ